MKTDETSDEEDSRSEAEQATKQRCKQAGLGVAWARSVVSDTDFLGFTTAGLILPFSQFVPWVALKA